MKQKHAAMLAMIIFCLAFSLSAFAQTKDAGAKHYKMSGVVKAVDAKGHALTIQHGDIPGFMGAMTMSYHAGKDEQIFRKWPREIKLRPTSWSLDKDTHLEGIKVTTPAKK